MTRLEDITVGSSVSGIAVIRARGAGSRLRGVLRHRSRPNSQLRAVIEKAGMGITEEYSWYDKTLLGTGNYFCVQKEMMVNGFCYDNPVINIEGEFL